MRSQLLITSFETWLPDQKSNTSDDLLGEVSRLKFFHPSSCLLRKLPVDRKLAGDRVLAQIDRLQPTGIICCGMAQTRSQMTVESQATRGEKVLPTTVDLDGLVAKLAVTTISHDAGDFVCNHLYYTVLQYLGDRQLPLPCLFVHVPLLDENNLAPIIADFMMICQELEGHESLRNET